MLQGMEERWHNEIKLLTRLRHENITTARQADQKEFARALSFPFLCMEYCEGGDLRQVGDHYIEQYAVFLLIFSVCFIVSILVHQIAITLDNQVVCFS